jgi:Lrp/AsnC family leucine-responsive transcriptional regulator
MKTPTMRDLDKTDRKILEILQEDGRITMTDLAPRIGLSVTPCTERVRRLERDGIIGGYHARLNPQALGLKALIFIEIRLHDKSLGNFEQVSRFAAECAEIMECHLVCGDFDYLLKARLPDIGDYRPFLSRVLAALPGADSHSYVVMEELKETLRLST